MNNNEENYKILIHITTLKSISELPFSIYKKDLIDFLKGKINPFLEKYKLVENKHFGNLYKLDESELNKLLNMLIKENLIEIKDNKISITAKGLKEILEKRYNFENRILETNRFTDIEKKLIKNFDFFLEGLNEPQKKAVVSPEKIIITIAGPGTGKTTILTKRIEFLVRFQNIQQKKILAITFTKKAKEQMIERLRKKSIINVEVETFNSFSEKILKKLKKGRLINFRDKKEIFLEAVKKTDFNLEFFIEKYFNGRKKFSDYEKLNQLIYDTFSYIDFIKNTKIGFVSFYNNLIGIEHSLAKSYYNVILKIEEILKKRDLRDFSDQVIDVIEIFKTNKNFIKEYDHILIDEFQDINEIQFNLINLIKWKNFFAVGDPRQSIFSWRGATSQIIENIKNYYPDIEMIYLPINYRSCKNIVDVSNIIIRDLMLPEIEAYNKEEGEVFLKCFKTFEEEILFIIEKIKNIKKRNQIFILARTNKLLERASEILKENSIKFKIKKDIEDEISLQKDEILLSTIHSIKGLENEIIFIIEVNGLYFPNRVKENFIQEALLSCYPYDKEKEELRLLYVGITRAKKKLYLLHTGIKSKFLCDEIKFFIKEESNNLKEFKCFNNRTIQRNMLKDLRSKIANILGVSTYTLLTNQEIEKILDKQPINREELEDLQLNNDFLVAKFWKEILEIFK